MATKYISIPVEIEAIQFSVATLFDIIICLTF